MKIKNWLLVLLILACAAGFYWYLDMDAKRTDTVPPVITIQEVTPKFSVTDDDSVLLRGLSAKDDRSGDVTDSLVVESVTLLDSSGNISVSYVAFDAAGNAAKITRIGRYTDYTSPKFTLNRPLLYPYGRSFDVLSDVGATDVLDGEIQHRVRAVSMEERAISDAGIHMIQFQVSNSLGDTVKYVFPVEVYNASAYNATLELKKYLVYLEKGASFRADRYLLEFHCTEGDTWLANRIPEGFELTTTGTVDTSQPGVYPVEYRMTYVVENEKRPELNRKYTAYTKQIVIVEG